MIDGYDIAAIAFAAPRLIAEWHVAAESARPRAQRQQYRRLVRLADFRLGRRPLRPQDRADRCPTCCSASSRSRPPIRPTSPKCRWLRFIAGLGIGGVIPNVVAINAEIGAAPYARDARDHRRRHRADGRRGGGLRQRALGAVLWLADLVLDRRHHADRRRARRHLGLPESIKYMALHESQRGKMVALIEAIRPGYTVPPNARFVIEDEQQSPSSNPIYLFGNGLVADHAADLADVRAST